MTPLPMQWWKTYWVRNNDESEVTVTSNLDVSREYHRSPLSLSREAYKALPYLLTAYPFTPWRPRCDLRRTISPISRSKETLWRRHIGKHVLLFALFEHLSDTGAFRSSRFSLMLSFITRSCIALTLDSCVRCCSCYLMQCLFICVKWCWSVTPKNICNKIAQ